MSNLEQNVQDAKVHLDAHAVEIVKWHFSPETGSPFWLDWAKEAGWNPAEEITFFQDIAAKFPHFQDEWLRDLPNWHPAHASGNRGVFAGRPAG